MTRRYFRLVCIWAAFNMAVFGFFGIPVWAQDSEKTGDQDVEVLAHGPIHEAFAETVTFDPQPETIAPKEPPPAIEEMPPAEKPDGDAQWIHGYWAWDDDRSDFIWVSGIWRVPPPDRQWIPGYWKQVDQGYQWISGYWASDKTTQTEYLPEPPESVEIGPNVNAPSPDDTWIPGCWIWHTNRYLWRPGYWANARADWLWVPAHYYWTPRGYLFVGGYWDYPVAKRGIIYAPVYIRPKVFGRVSFSFSPGFVIDLNVFSDCLFIRPGYRHYYFGDYYAAKYYRGGIYPWFSLHARRNGYDPIFSHQRWMHRHDAQWEHHLQQTFMDRRKDKNLRPSRWVTSAVSHVGTGNAKGSNHRPVVMPINQTHNIKGTTYRYKQLSEKERHNYRQREQQINTYRNERRQRESRRYQTTTPKDSRHSGHTSTFNRSPVVSNQSGQHNHNNAPPSRYKVPKTNSNVEPLQRQTWGPTFGGQQQNKQNNKKNHNSGNSDNKDSNKEKSKGHGKKRN